MEVELVEVELPEIVRLPAIVDEAWETKPRGVRTTKADEVGARKELVSISQALPNTCERFA